MRVGQRCAQHFAAMRNNLRSTATEGVTATIASYDIAFQIVATYAYFVLITRLVLMGDH